jgi:hypothetical protein
MPLSEELTGRPPCVTVERLDRWRKLADDIDSALMMGGEQGMELLTSIMADWCEAVDDINTALQICWDLAGNGLRQEAIDWHAAGFFEVVDRLNPDRPGWDEWEVALVDAGISVPRLDGDLKQLVDGMFEELEVRDLSGQSVADYMRALRKSILARGHLGERLVILESLRALDPGTEAWNEMIAPIQQQRAGEIEREVARALQDRDVAALGRLRSEVQALVAGGGLPDRLAVVMQAVDHWTTLAESRRPLADLAAMVVGKCNELRATETMSPAWLTLVEAAMPLKDRLAAAMRKYGESIRAGSSVPAVAKVIDETGISQAFSQLKTTIRPELAYLDEVRQSAQAFDELRSLAEECARHAAGAPAVDLGWEGFKAKRLKWLQAAKQREWDLSQKLTELPVAAPPFAVAAVSRLQAAAAQVETIHRGIRVKETLILTAVFGGIALLVGVFVLFLVVGGR